MGPIVIFDKSTLQSLNVDEAVWLHTFYSANVTTLLFVETLGDLEKAVRKGRTPEDVVGNLAAKAALLGARANVHHQSMCVDELLGGTIEMRGVPVVSSGQSIVTANRTAVLLRPAPEEEALRRWQRGEFLEVERLFARLWRRSLTRLDLGSLKLSLPGFPRPRTMEEAKRIADRVIDRDGWRYPNVRLALAELGVPARLRALVLSRWKAMSGPPFWRFAPYTAHVLTVETFFRLCLDAGLISDKRPSNRADLAYLYYLPFCMMFVSSDKLHERIVPLFLKPDQVFVKGGDLKADLAKLDAHFSALPLEVRRQGVMKFAQYPPTGGGFLTTDLWDRLMSPVWRENAARPDTEVSDDVKKALSELVQKLTSGASKREVTDAATADAVVVETKVPVQIGKWRILPPGIEDDSKQG